MMTTTSATTTTTMMVLATLLVWCTPSLVTASNQHLRSPSMGNSNTGNSDDDYRKLVDCMFKGADPAMCHQMDCFWCRSKLFSLCVTSDTAANIGGTMFQCEDPPPAPDDGDDAATKPPCPCNDDCNGKDDDGDNDDATPPPTDPPAPPADDDGNDAAPPTDDAAPPPAADDFWIIDDAVPPATDDAAPPPPPTTDDAGPADETYMIDLLRCMQHSQDGCGLANETDCVWCGNARAFSMGLCLSEAAAKNMEGALYTCDWPAVAQDGDRSLPTISNDHHNDLASNHCPFFEEDECRQHCHWCDLDRWGGVCLDSGAQFDMLDRLATCGTAVTRLQY
jgi:hypothetical protein